MAETPSRNEILDAAMCAVADELGNLRMSYEGPALAAYVGVRAVLMRHLSRVEGARESDYTLAPQNPGDNMRVPNDG